MTSTVKLAEYLFTRLRQLGVDAIHGVPGDYNLTLLDYVEPAGLEWVGNANELNAGYAADAYSRIKGVGALITTFGVGELSAINAIAGAYTERAAVVHIVGTPERASQDGRVKIHHTFNDGEYRRFAQMHEHVTIAQTSLRDPRTSPDQIDHVLQQCLIHSRPVYIEVPVDLVPAPVSSEKLSTKITLPDTVPTPAHDTAIAKVLDTIYDAKQPAILIDGETRALGIVDEVETFVKTTKWPTWTSGFGKGLIDETIANVHGVYQGRYDTVAQDFINASDLVICFGPHFSSTNTYGFTSMPNLSKTISITDTEIKLFDQQVYRDIPARTVLNQLLSKLDPTKAQSPYTNKYPTQLKHYTPLSMSPTTTPSTDPITQSKLWRVLSTFLLPGDILMGETGTAGYGCRVMPLPPHSRLFTPTTWLSIGYMLPAAQGASLAQRSLIQSSTYHSLTSARTVLLIGDGSFQMTAQELGTIIRLRLDVVIFLINNDGYTIERCIHGLKQKYNDVARWKYLKAPEFFGAEEGSVYTAQAKDWGELEGVLKDERLIKGKGLRMVEIFMDREDVPPGPLTMLMEKQFSDGRAVKE